MAIDYQADIAPLRQQFFPMLGGGQNFDANLNYHQSVVAPMQEQTMKLQNNMLRMQQQEMAFERQKLALNSARRRAQMETETMSKLPELNKRLSEMFDSPDTTPEQLAEGVGALTMEFAPVAAYNPAMENVLRSAQNRVRTAEQREYKKSILDDREDRRRFGIISQAAQVGDAELVRRVAGQDDVVTPDEELYIGLADTYQKRGEQKQLAEMQEKQFEQSESYRKERAGDLDKLQSVLRGLKPVEAEEQWQKALNKDGQVDPNAVDKLPAKFELEEQSRLALEAAVLRMRPDVDPARLREFDDKELLRATMMDAARERAALQPQLPQRPSRIQSGFGS